MCRLEIPGTFDNKKQSVDTKTERNLHGPNQPDFIKDYRHESTGENAGYLHRLATVNVFGLFFVIDKYRSAFVDHLIFLTITCKQNLDEQIDENCFSHFQTKFLLGERYLIRNRFRRKVIDPLPTDLYM